MASEEFIPVPHAGVYEENGPVLSSSMKDGNKTHCINGEIYYTKYANREEYRKSLEINGYYVKPTGMLRREKTNLIPLDIKFARAGIIPSAVIDGVRQYCLGVDTKYDELTDFGGGVKGGDSDWLYNAIRELREESHGVFDFSDSKEYLYNNSVAIHDGLHMILICCEIKIENLKDVIYQYKFKSTQFKKGSGRKDENCRLVWVPESVLVKMYSEKAKVVTEAGITYRPMYERVRDFLACTDGFFGNEIARRVNNPTFK